MVERRSIGSRILSALLAVCLLVSMVPSTALSVFAADSATAGNVAAIREYAATLLNSNFSKAASEDSSSKNDKFTWDTEGKNTNWRYYNGVMLDALLMLGVDSSAGNALEFAKDFMDTNTEDASKAVTHYITKEVDSVPPALVLFDLLNTAEVTESDRAIYVKAINYVYGQLEAQTSYDQCGGNLLHKMDNTSWATWNIGLDGIYMAQPFYMEYANALAKGEITNTVNSKSASDIYKEVYDRLMWVADNMYDSATGLYHHGWNVEDSEGNGHFWSRGIGWYAAGLVMCIDLMPEGQYKTDLIAKAVKVFDGMLPYQDASGLWYNVVNRNSSLTANNGNKLEASGTALMAYAMMKAYNEGWVTDSKYATAAEKGFNGIVSAMESGKIVNIYKSSGVCTNDDDYCKNDYVSDEAKGVGPVLMAAAEVSKYADVEEEFNIGVVVAPEIAVAKGATTLSTTNGIKATLVSNHGTVKNVPASQLTYAVGDTSGSTAIVTVKNGDYTIDTFQVNVVDTSGNNTVTGTFYVEETVSDTPTAPSVTKNGWVQISAGGDGTTTYVLDVDGIDDGAKYIVVDYYNNNAYALGHSGTGEKAYAATVSGDKVTIADSNLETAVWTFTKRDATVVCDSITYQGYYIVNGTTYLRNSNTVFTTSQSNGEVFAATYDMATGQYRIALNASTSAIRDLNLASTSDWKRGEDDETLPVYLYKQTAGTSGSAEYASLNGTATYEYPVGTSTNIVNQIKSDYVVKTSANSDGSSASNVDWSNVTLSWDKTLDVNTEGTYTATVTYGTKTLGTIPVLIYGGTVEVAYNVTLTVPSGYVADFEQVGQYVGYMGYSCAVTNASGNSVSATYTVNVESEDTGIATYNEGLINGQSVGSTNIVVSVDTVTYNGKEYAVTGAVAKVPVVLNDKLWTNVTYQATGATLAPDTVELGKTTQVHGYAEASDGTTHSYGFNWTSDNIAVATVNSSTGVITPVSIGTATITGTLSKVDGEDYWTGNSVTVTVTVVAASGEEPEETTTATTTPAEPEYTYTILGSNGSALSGQNITMNAGDTYTPTFSVSADGSDVTGSYSMTLEATSNASAVSISGTTITANKVNSDTVVNITATVTPNSRAAASGTSVDFTVTVKAATASDDSGYYGPFVAATSVQNNGQYVITSKTYTRTLGYGGTTTNTASWTESDGNYTDANKVVQLWTFVLANETEGSYYICYTVDGTTHYLVTDGDNYPSTTSTFSDSITRWTVTKVSDSDVYVNIKAVNSTVERVDLNVQGSGGAKLESGVYDVRLFTKSVTCTHNYTSSVTTAATCTTDGVRTYTCSECGDTDTETIAALGHSYTSAVTTQPGCETNGVRTYTCSNDNSHTYTEGIAAAGHSWNSGTVTAEPTCTATGVKTYTCTNDGSHTKTETVAALGHNYVNGTCTVCGEKDPNAGDTTGGNKYIHNFTTDGDTDPDEYFTISGNYSNTAATIDGTSYTRGMKLESSAGTVTFTAASAGTLTLHIATGTSSVKIDGKNYDVTNGVFTIDLEAGSHTISKGDGGGPLYYIEYAEQGGGSTEPEPEPSYTYELYTPTGSQITSFQQFNIEVGDTWRPTVKVYRNGVDVSGEYTLVLGSNDNAVVSLDGDTATAIAQGTANLNSIAVKDSNGNTVHDFSGNGSVVALFVSPAAPLTYTGTISFNSDTFTMTEAQAHTQVGYTVTITDSKGNTVTPDQCNVTWSLEEGYNTGINGDTRDFDCVTVTNNGVVSAVNVGTTTMTATLTGFVKDGVTYDITGVSDTISVTVTADDSVAVKSPNWWGDHSQSFEITESIQSWSFVSRSYATAADNFDTATVVVFRSDDGTVTGGSYVEELIIRSDSFAVSEENGWSSDGGQPSVSDKVYPSDWTEWKTANINGAQCVVTAQLVDGNIIIGFTNNGVTNVYSVPANTDNTNPVYLCLTGEECSVLNLQETQNHIDISVANSDGEAAISVDKVWAAHSQPAEDSTVGVPKPTVTYNGEEVDTYTVVYTVDESNGTYVTTEDDGTIRFRGENLGTVKATATLTSVTVDGEVIPLAGVYCDFDVQTLPWWEPKQTDSITVEAGQTITFTYSGDMPGLGKGAGYVDDIRLMKVGTDDPIRYKNFDDNNLDGWVTVNSFDDIQNSKDIDGDGTPEVWYSLRLYRQGSDGTYQNLSASYSITVEEAGTYYFTYNQMIEDENGIGTMTGTMAVEEEVTPGSVYIHNFTEHDKNSEFYTITGSLSKDKGSVSYDGDTLTQCLKMESGTNITFDADNAGTLTLVFGGTTDAAGKKVKIDGTSYTVGDDGTLTVELAAGEHTITKGDSINLFYMAYAEEGSTGGTGGTTGGSTTVRYELYTGNGSDIANDDIFLIVNEGQTIALMNDDDGESGDIAGLSAAITIDGSYAIIGSTDEPYATWKVSGWKEGTKEDLKYYSMIFGNGSRFIQDSSSKILQDSGKTLYLVKTETPGKYALAAGVAVSDGELVASGNHWFYDATNNIWTKNKETIGYVYLYKQTVITSGVTVTEPGRLYIGGTSSMPTVDLTETVTVNGATLDTDDYSITWSIVSGGDYIDLNAASGLVTAKKGGTAVVRATVTVGEGDSAVTYTDDVNVTVINPGVTVTEELSLIHGVAGSNTGSTATVVTANNTNTNNYKVTYLSSNTNVATVDNNGNITTVGKGTATITATLTEVNGLTVSQLGIKAATIVTVTEKEVATANLNTYDYIVQKDASDSELQDVLKHMILSVDYNTGDSFTAQYGTDTNLKIDLTTVNTSEAGRQYAIVTYTDAEGKEIFRDTVWIHVEDFDPDDYDGVVTGEMNITFILDDDGVNVNKEYVIVANGYAIALLNPSATSDSCGAATTGSVTISGNTLTMVESNAPIASWLIDTPVNVTIGGNTVAQYNASNFLRYLGIDDNMMLIHHNVEHVYITHLGNGEYQIVLSYNDDGTPAYYLAYDGSKWTASTTASSVYLYRKDAIIEDYTLNFELNPTTASIPEGFTTTLNTTIKYNKDTVILDPSRYQIAWSSSNTDVATVDQKGNVTGVSEGDAIITAKLVAVDGFEVIDNETDLPYIIETATVTVVDADPVPVLTPSSLTIGVGSMPNLNKVNVKMTYGADTQYDQVVTHELLTFHMADAEGTLSDGTKVTGFSSAKPGVFTVQVEYAGQKFPLTIRVDEDPYAGLDPADSIPGYPDAGAVRMDKTATGVIDFNSTGLVKLELTAAGISTKSSVDVVLVVDVSNSMAWSMDWFSEEHYNAYLDGLEEDADEMTYDEWVKASRDPAKIPAVNDDNTINGATKLDMAMSSASAFADILLNVEGGDNTLTFVTFAGNDEEHGGIDGNMDSVRTPFVGVTDYNTAKGVFDATEFTHLVVDGNSVSYYLNIGGSTANGYGDAAVTSGYGSDDALKNRGNTNYDYAFGEATDAVVDLKAQYKANTGKDYDSSDRQLYVVFMTDGAPSAYNGIYLNGKNSDTMYANTKGNGDDDKGDAYSQSDDANSESEWLTHIKGYHNLATSLEEEIYGYYTVGFDLAHGGFGDYSWHEDEMERVLSGMVRNSVVPVTMATDEAQLNAFYTNLAKALAYAGTNAKVTDQIGSEFSLFTGVHMYADNIVELTQNSEHALTTETWTELGTMDFSVEILSYRLVLAADIGDELSVIDTDGTVKTVTVSNEHLGLRVNETPKVIETITFSYDEETDTTAAYSDVIGEDENIMSTAGDGAVTINANYFTYTSTPETDENGQAITSEDIIWKIGDITDREIAMSYYAYLEGSLDGTDVSEGMYQTNEFAYLEYIDVYGDYVKRDYGIPEVAWGKAGVTVRFYLVNEDGRFVNRAGVPFDNPANRIFLDGRTTYSTDLNNFVDGKEKLVIDALKALTAAGLANNELYDTHLKLTLTTDYASKQQGGVEITDFIKENIASLVFINDVMNDGSYANTIIDIPVILSDLGMSVRPLASSTVVMDYGKPMDISVFSVEEMNYVRGWHDYRNGDDSGTLYIYDMTVVGFAEYSSQFDQRTYVEEGKFQNTLTTNNGSYQVISANGETQIRFTPSGMLDEVETVFVVVKFQEYNDLGMDNDGNYIKTSPTNQFYYMYKQLNIVPATVMYYETDFANGVFTTDGTWSTEGTSSNESQNVYEAGGVYGFDSTYSNNKTFSNGSSLNVNVDNTNTGELETNTVSFTFTGTGFDIISRTGVDQATIRVTYTNVETKVENKVTVINKGVSELYQIPVVSVNDLTYGTYNVCVEVFEAYDPIVDGVNETNPLYNVLKRGGEFYFDAVRIHNPVTGTEIIQKAELVDNVYKTSYYTVNSVYGSDGEYAPVIQEVGKLLIDAETFNDTGDNTANGVLYLDDEGSLANGSTNVVDTYDKIGPNHEVYLSKNSGIAFILNVSDLANLASIDIAAKTVNDSAPVLKTVIRNVQNAGSYVEVVSNVNSATAQYYSLLPAGHSPTFTDLFTTPNSNDEVYVIIVNASESESILSLTDLKIAFSGGTSAVETLYSLDLAEVAAPYVSRRFAPVIALDLAEDGNWYYYVNGEVDYGYNGLQRNDFGIWYIKNGQIDFSYNGLTIFEGETFYIRGGRVSTESNGLHYVEGEWRYFTEGMVDTAFTGLAANDFGTWYVEGGKIDFSMVGLAENNGELWYVRYGQYLSTYTGLVYHNGEWLYVNSGVVDYTYTGLAYNAIGWWYVENGRINFNYTGIASNETGSYYVKHGQVDFTVTVE